MKRKTIILFSAIALLFCAQSQAQNPRVAPYGWYLEDGELQLNIPTTLLAVDVEVECADFKAGVFARYALKYLGVSADLVGKKEYKIVDGSISICEDKLLYTSSLSGSVLPEKQLAPTSDLIIATSQGSIKFSEETRAAAFAKRLFTLRQQRGDLISGDVGEGVFGEGLKAALESIANEEEQILRMFLGETTTTKSVERFFVKPESQTRTYILCRFSDRGGIAPASDINGTPIYLQINAMEVPQLNEATPNSKGEYKLPVMQYSVAAETICTLYNNTQSVTTANLPIFEFGRTFILEVPSSYYQKQFGREFK